MAGNNWLLASGGKGYGPFSPDQLRQLVDAGLIDHDDLVWREGASDSTPASTVGNEPPALPVVASRPLPPPLPVPSTPASSHRPNRFGVWLAVSAVLLAMLAGGGWFAYERGWLVLGERSDSADASVAENSSANSLSDEEADEPASSAVATEPASPAVATASDFTPALAEVAPQSFHGLNAPPEETVPEATDPVTLPVPVLYLPFDPSVATIPSNQTVRRKGGRYVAGRMGQAVSFDSPSYVVLEASLPLGNSPRTLALWVRNDRGPVMGHTPFMVSQTEKWERAKAFGIIQSRNGNWRFQDMNGDLDSGIKVDPDWHHLAVTHDGNTIRFFLDGRNVAEADRKLETESRRLKIGGLGSSTNDFIGLIDELYVFDVPLTENQIRQLMNEAGSSSASREVDGERPDDVHSVAQRPSPYGKVVAGNVALSSKGATVNKDIRNPWAINDGKTPDNWREYAKASLNEPIVVTLDSVYRLQSIRFQLVGNEGYRYFVEVSADGKTYEVVQDRRHSGSWSGWQTVSFAPRSVKVIRLTGTYDVPNQTGIRVGEIEAYCTNQ